MSRSLEMDKYFVLAPSGVVLRASCSHWKRLFRRRNKAGDETIGDWKSPYTPVTVVDVVEGVDSGRKLSLMEGIEGLAGGAWP